jgi:hypothetical protein
MKSLIAVVVAGFICLMLAQLGVFSVSLTRASFMGFIYLVIFLFIICFICTFKYWEKTTRKKIVIYIVIYCCVNAVTAWSFENMHVRKDYEGLEEKACLDNIRIINGAVEMYNMDKDVMMDDLDIHKLLEGNYIYKELSVSDKCNYTNVGKLSKDGFVCCIKHYNSQLSKLGNNDGLNNNIVPTSKLSYSKLKELKEEIESFNKKIREKKSFFERAAFYLKENKHEIKSKFYPFFVLFWPTFLSKI